MPDIFISYSRQDSAQAEQLTELLVSAGLSCWIDRQGIDLATSWSREIVQAIDQCKAFVVLISPSSNVSTNVHKEVALASEKKKKILPLDLEPVALSEDLQYQLAGLQRSPMTNIDAIIRALGKLGLEATGAPQAPKIVQAHDGRKSLMILPFEDLSPTGDNGWFADGLSSELISALSNVKALRVTDPQATKDFKRYQGTLPRYAREMNIRYFVQGDVRKFGDTIKITTRLLDIESGDQLWQDSMKGTMNDIFDIQEKVAKKVVEGMNIHLASDERKKLVERGTDNAEAYELFMKAGEYYSRLTREGHRLAIAQFTEVIRLDPNFADALRFKAYVLAIFFRNYDRDAKLLEEAESLTRRALELKPTLSRAYETFSYIYRLQGKLKEGEAAAKEFVRRAPENPYSHSALGIFYSQTDQPALAIAPYEQALDLKPDNLTSYFNLVLVSDRSGDRQRVEKWSRAALPYFEKHLRLVPDDETMRIWYANLLEYAGERTQAVEALQPLLALQKLDGLTLYNIGCLYARLSESVLALTALHRSVQAGFAQTEVLRTDPDLDSLRMQPEFQTLLQEMGDKTHA